MATIVFVHGINQEQKSADLLEATWTPALAGGLRNGGHGDLADRLVAARGLAERIDSRLAFYGDLFLKRGKMGGDSTNPVDEDGELAFEWLNALATSSTDRQARSFAAAQVDRLRRASRNGPMGVGRVVAPAVRALCNTPFAAELGFNLATFVQGGLGQVRLYMQDFSLAHEALQRVESVLSDDTRVLIAHSLGSVVAFEIVHRLKRPLPLFVTLGSPLGLRRPIYERLSSKGRYPGPVRRWLNMSDPDDFVAGVPNLRDLYGGGKPDDAIFEDVATINNGASPHRAEYYLGKSELGAAVAQALRAR